jgi:hypothetical protein
MLLRFSKMFHHKKGIHETNILKLPWSQALSKATNLLTSNSITACTQGTNAKLAYLEKFRISEYSRNVWNVTGKQIPHLTALLLNILLRTRPLTGLLTEYCPVSYQTCWSSVSISHSETLHRLRSFCWSKASVRIYSACCKTSGWNNKNYNVKLSL